MTASKRPNSHEEAYSLEQALQIFADLIAADEVLETEFIRSRREFLPADITNLETAYAGDPSRERRHLEWFLFERQSRTLKALPMEGLLNNWRAQAQELPDAPPEDCFSSLLGIFEVLGVDPRGDLELRELAGLTPLTLPAPASLSGLSSGDLLVGRFYPFGGGLYEPSSAMGLFRKPELLAALKQDLQHLRELRSHVVMRLTQLELEHMFWGVLDAPQNSALHEESESDPVGEMERFFLDNDITRQALESWKRALSNTQPVPDAIAAGSNDLVGTLLEQLAFDTEIDLQAARAHLLAAWPALTHSKPGAALEPLGGPQPPLDPQEVKSSLEELDRDRASGLDVETSFQELERRLGLNSDEPEPESSAPDFPGVVGAMVTEFLWERDLDERTNLSAAEREAWKEALGLFAEYTAKLGVFENLGERDVLSFLTFWLPESRRLTDATQAQQVVRAIDAFAGWVKDAHQLTIMGAGLAKDAGALEADLKRAIQANLQLAVDRKSPGELFEFCGALEDQLAMIRDQQGEERQVRLERELLKVLEDGDLLRGHTDQDGSFVVGCCYPPQAGELRQRTV